MALASTHSGSQMVAVLTRSGRLPAAMRWTVVSCICCQPTTSRLTFTPGWAAWNALTWSCQNGAVFGLYSATMKLSVPERSSAAASDAAPIGRISAAPTASSVLRLRRLERSNFGITVLSSPCARALSPRRVATIDHEVLARDIGRCVGSKVDHRALHLVGGGEALHRHALDEGRGIGSRRVGLDPARADAVHADVAGRIG